MVRVEWQASPVAPGRAGREETRGLGSSPYPGDRCNRTRQVNAHLFGLDHMVWKMDTPIRAQPIIDGTKSDCFVFDKRIDA